MDEIHSYNTRKKSKTNYFLPRVNAAQTKKLLVYNGTKIWNQILKEIREMKFLQCNKELQNLYIYHSTQFKEHKILNQGVQEIKFLSICHTLIQSKIVKFDVVSFCYEL